MNKIQLLEYIIILYDAVKLKINLLLRKKCITYLYFL